MLTRSGRRLRSAGTAIVLLLLLAGTAIGQDDAFPFGPFRMYATRDDPDGVVVSTRVEALDRDGRRVLVPDSATGLRRAEIEGQAGRFERDPTLLAAVSRAHDRLRPDQPRYVAVRVIQRLIQLHDSRPVGAAPERVVASWHR